MLDLGPPKVLHLAEGAHFLMGEALLALIRGVLPVALPGLGEAGEDAVGVANPKVALCLLGRRQAQPLAARVAAARRAEGIIEIAGGWLLVESASRVCGRREKQATLTGGG